MTYFPPYSRRMTHRESRRVRTETEQRRSRKRHANRQHRGRASERQLREQRLQENGVYTFTLADWDRLIERFDSCCAYCAQPDILTVDHVIPISRGGSHGPGNILPACFGCNNSKGDLLLSEWRYRRTRYC